MTAPWWNGPALAFDTESTGVNVQNDRVVTVAMVHLGSGKPTREGYLVNPGIDIPEGATAIHGITTAHAFANGLNPVDVLDTTAGALALAVTQGTPIVGMNVAFDFSLLHFDCLRHGVQTVSARLGGHDRIRPVVDVFVLDKQVATFRKGSRKLDALCQVYGVKHHGAHDSGYDALAAAEIAAQIAQRNPRIGRMNLDELHEAQARWKAEQNASLQRHFDGKRAPGAERNVIETGWPLLDIATAVKP